MKIKGRQIVKDVQDLKLNDLQHPLFCSSFATAYRQQNHMGNNSGSVGLQRMDGSTFPYFSQQSTYNVYEQELSPNSSRNLCFNRMGGSSVGNQETSTANHHSRHMRDRDATMPLMTETFFSDQIRNLDLQLIFVDSFSPLYMFVMTV